MNVKQVAGGFPVRLGRACLALSLASVFVFAEPVSVSNRSMVQAQASAVFSRIDVAGNQRIAADTIRTIAGIPAGTRVSPAQINAGTQNLVNSGLFEKVVIRPEGGRLVIDVIENPTISRISIEGNKRLKDDALLALIGSQPRRAYSAAQAEADVAAIAEAYAQSGRVAAKIEPKIIRRSDNRVDLVFEVREGRIVEVNRIGFTGNRVYSDRRLRSAIDSKQAGLFRAFVRKDTYIQDRIEFDKQKLREFYTKRGYVDAAVVSSSAEFSRNRNGFLLNFKIQEGQQYNFGALTVSSLEPDVNIADYATAMKLKAGKPFNPRDVEKTLERLDIVAYDAGLPFVQAVPRVTRNDDTRTIDIDFELVRGEKVFVERIDIEGNSTTLDRVIRRQFRVIEGDPFNRREIRQATDRIRALGFFSDVQVEAREGSSPNKVIIDVNVVEQPTGSLGFGVGYGTDDGLNGSITLSEDNFLGRGQSFSLSLTTSSEAANYSLGFTEPAVLGRDLSAGFDLFYRETSSSFNSYNTKRIAFIPRVAFPVSENAELELSYRLSSDEVIPESSSSEFIKAESGDLLTSALGIKYTIDKRNSPVDPTAGFVVSFDQTFAVLGGETNYYKAVANAKTFRSFFNEDVVLSVEVEGGLLHSITGNSRVIDRFQLGGNSLRGFESFGVGPRDQTGGIDEPLGGNMYAVARLEASFPLGLPEEYGMHGGLFFDIGSVWGLDVTSVGGSTVNDDFEIRSAIGFSLFWETVLGPLRFNFAKPIDYVDGVDKTQSFNFTIDTRF